MTMYDHEVSDEERKRILIGLVRNNVITQTIFSPWHGLEFCYVDGMLCRVYGVVQGEQKICSIAEVVAMNDDELYNKIVEETKGTNEEQAATKP